MYRYLPLLRNSSSPVLEGVLIGSMDSQRCKRYSSSPKLPTNIGNSLSLDERASEVFLPSRLLLLCPTGSCRKPRHLLCKSGSMECLVPSRCPTLDHCTSVVQVSNGARTRLRVPFHDQRAGPTNFNLFLPRIDHAAPANTPALQSTPSTAVQPTAS